MSVTYPSQVTILGQDIRVRVIDRDTPMPEHEGGALLGCTEFAKGVITVRGTDVQSEDSFRDTLLHEVLHEVFHLHGLAGYLASTDDGEGNVEEPMVRDLTGALLAVIRGNPFLVQSLTDTSGEQPTFLVHAS